MDPKRGYVSMCNNRFASDHFDLRSSLHEITTGRAYRIDKVLREGIAAGKKFNFEHFKELQLDVKD